MNEILSKHKDQENLFLNTLKILDKQYLSDNSYDLVEQQETEAINFKTSLGFFNVEKFVFEKDCKIIDKLSSVYSAIYSENATLLMKIISDGNLCSIYIGVKKNKKAAQSGKVLKGALEGNFPGITFENEDGLNANELSELNEIIFKDIKVITTVLGVPSLKNKEDDSFLQGIENLILGMQGKPFSALFIADPIAVSDIEEAKLFYESVYSELSILKEQTYNLGSNESQAFTKSSTETIGNAFSSSKSESESESRSEGKTKGTNKSKTRSPWIGKAIKNKIFGSTNLTGGTSSSTSTTDSKSTSLTNSVSESINKSIALSNSDSKTTGTTSSIQFTQENKTISNALEKLDLQFERLKKGESLGLWNVGAFFLSADRQDSVVAANIYNGIIKGEETRAEKSAVRTFEKNDANNFESLLNSVKNYEIPTIKLHEFDHYNRLASIITTNELSISMSLPHKSFIGIDVIEVAPFGNNIKVINNEKSIKVGKLYNYEKKFTANFNLDLEKFTGHVFVTGSTGSGKSNATYTIIKQLIKNDIKFMVIEPAKGEYKDVFGTRDDVTVFSTNAELSHLLQLNPFSFPKSVHIYEHIDRLIEILNSCWTMEAAMPAFLKEAVIMLYINKGWDLESSKNLIQENYFPTFKDLADLLPTLIEKSAFSAEVKGNYTGALVTRVKSMTNGLLKLMFTEKEIAPEKLFDANVIVDLSRVASSETKSLLMGILFMKLQEYRMTTSTSGNAKLKHVAIIEEAHNLIKNTSSEQSQGGANVQGKSVEMISNAIAEMRTYGQGFVLADQSPGLLDPSAIRNTNTKICLRLPFKEDRELVGKAMNLTENQINELAKLKTGVAAVYQNDWQEAVLCKFEEFKNSNKSYEFKSKEGLKTKIICFLAKQIVARRLGDEIDKEKLEKLSSSEYSNLVKQIMDDRLSEDEIAKVLFELLKVEELIKIVNSNDDANSANYWNRLFTKLLIYKWNFKQEQIEFKEINNLILKHCTSIDINFGQFYQFNRNKLLVSS
ncbi:ATP-binding protein [Flavobacterium frigidarium]|uniref:ATP-binding protein n=1 Tax=Flavobacterium frigidarium TaxID=99286 RepID=A0ABV4KAI8_9FLAO